MIEIEPDDGTVRVELPGGGAIMVEGLLPETPVQKGEQRALFLSSEEAETLGKMIAHILNRIRITEESEQRLRTIQPRVEGLFQDS